MTDLPPPSPSAVRQPGWRLAQQADAPFIYELVTQVDPRWWRFSRAGLEPSRLLATAGTIAAGVIVHDALQRPMACGVLADAGASGTGTMEYFARPTPEAEELARQFAPDLVIAAFSGAPIRRLYLERFDGDPRLFGDLEDEFEVEVRYPSYAMIGGVLEGRTVSVLTHERFAAWREARS